jgi:hypothetical protein
MSVVYVAAFEGEESRSPIAASEDITKVRDAARDYVAKYNRKLGPWMPRDDGWVANIDNWDSWVKIYRMDML